KHVFCSVIALEIDGASTTATGARSSKRWVELPSLQTPWPLERSTARIVCNRWLVLVGVWTPGDHEIALSIDLGAPAPSSASSSSSFSLASSTATPATASTAQTPVQTASLHASSLIGWIPLRQKLPTPLAQHAACVKGSKLYVF